MANEGPRCGPYIACELLPSAAQSVVMTGLNLSHVGSALWADSAFGEAAADGKRRSAMRTLYSFN